MEIPTIDWRTPGKSPAALSLSQRSKPQRVLACILCQNRKIKCDRQHPCSNCIKSRAQCIPAKQLTSRKRRFPERELLERLRQYEDLLRQNSINFEPLHKNPAREKDSPNVEEVSNSEGEKPMAGGTNSSPSTTVTPETKAKSKAALHTLNQESQDSDRDSDSSDDDVRRVDINKAWEQIYALENNDHLFFASRATALDISTLHPETIQVFRLWQIYLDNVNPLLKVTHSPSMQGRIVEAVSHISNIEPTLEALMFSMYCMSIESLAVDVCQTMFNSSKKDLLRKYQFGCQQALLNCGFLKCGDRDCLTALYLYLISVRSYTIPQSLSSMLGVAIRIAQRMGMNSETALLRCTALEAEMRRRLWWSLALFDTRIGELADSNAATLTATWDCRIVLNVNDADFPSEIKEPPLLQVGSTDALFAVVRSELGNFVRQTNTRLAFNNTASKHATIDILNGLIPESAELTNLEEMIEDKYLQFCDKDNPLHFMTIWTTRAQIAKYRLMEHHHKFPSGAQADTHDTAMFYALKMLDCDTELMTSPLTKGFQWLIQLYFPFPAYLQILQALKRRPLSDQAEQAWEVMSKHHQVHFGSLRAEVSPSHGPLFEIFGKIVLQAWVAHEAAFGQIGKSLKTPGIVSTIRSVMAQQAQNRKELDAEPPEDAIDLGFGNDLSTLPLSFNNNNLLYGTGEHVGNVGVAAIPFLDFDINHLNWSAMDWDSFETSVW